MDNIIYERDYTLKTQKFSDFIFEDREKKRQIYACARRHGVFEEFNQIMNSMPKVIIPEDKAHYEQLLEELDQMAMKYGGKIHGEIRYDKWESEIVLFIPFLEFVDTNGYAVLRDIANMTGTVTIDVTKEGGIRLRIMIPYFAELFDGQTSTSDILDSIIKKHADLVQMLDDLHETQQQHFIADVSSNPGFLKIFDVFEAEEGCVPGTMLDEFKDCIELLPVDYTTLLLECITHSSEDME